jgi:hypothetical protein
LYHGRTIYHGSAILPFLQVEIHAICPLGIMGDRHALCHRGCRLAYRRSSNGRGLQFGPRHRLSDGRVATRSIVQRGLRTPTGQFFARFFIGIIPVLVAEFAFMLPSTRVVLSSSAARWKGRKPIGGLKSRPGCSTGRHTLTHEVGYFRLDRLCGRGSERPPRLTRSVADSGTAVTFFRRSREVSPSGIRLATTRSY